MIIGERLREIREQKDLSQGDVEKKTGLLRFTSPAWKMDTRFQQSKPWKSSQEPWKSPCTSFFMTGKNHQLHSSIEKKVCPMDGASRAKEHGCCIGSGVC